jgi:dipeptidyl aminopeptidase/acylaminoacyl peptidase
MIIKAQKFTPEVLLSAPRRGPAVPNHDGSLALFAVSTYSFETKKTAKEIRVLDIKTGTSALFTDDETAHDVNWLGDGTNAIIWLQSGAKGITSLMVGDGEDPSKASYTADVILAPFCDLKLKALDDRTIACVMSGKATTEGKLYNEETAEKSPSTARIYDELRVRFWDRYLTPEKTVLWYSKLVKKDGKYSLAAPVHNALKGTDFECPSYNPLGSGVDEFDICTNGIIFRAADPTANAALGRPADIYFLPLSSFTEEKPPALERITTGSYFGEASNPRFSPCGKRIAFLKTTDESSMFPRLMLVPDLKESLEAMDLLNSAAGKPWNLSPGGFEWSKDGKSLLVTADDCGRVVLFDLPLNEGRNLIFRPLTQDGVVSGFYPLGDSGRLLVSSSSLVESSKYSVIDTSEPLNQHVVSTASKNGLKLGLSPKQVSDMYFEGAGDYCVQAFIVKPRSFDENKKYPLALLIHGGPEDAWREAWSTRWNPACWAEQGYVCVMPNVTGSVGFGKEFTEGKHHDTVSTNYSLQL